MASRLDFSQIRSLYVGTSSSTQVDTNNLIVAGNVGIGTTSPNRTLTVNGIVGVTNGTANTQQLVISTDANGVYLTSSYIGSSSYVPMIFETGGSEGMRITSGRNLLIGTTTDAGYRVNLSGDINVSGAVRLAGGGATVTFISESWGINLNGSDTQPTQVRGSSFSVGYVLGAGTNYGTGNMFVAGSVGIGTTGPTRSLHVVGTTRHERVYAYANNTFQFTNDVPSNSLWLHLGTQASFTTDKIYYRVNTQTSEEEGEIIVSNTCVEPLVEWHRNSYNVMVTAVKARMQGSCQPCEIWIQVRYGSNYGGANTTVQWQVHSGTDGGFTTVNATGTPGTGTNEKNLTNTDGYFYETSGNIKAPRYSNAGFLGTGQNNARNHFTPLGAGSASPATGWIAAAFGDALADRIVIGQWTNGAQQAIFGAHTANLNDWADTNYVSKNHKFYYNGDWSITPALTINTSGNVLIGTTSDNGNKLRVQGTTWISGNVYTNGEQGVELAWTGNTINDNRIGRIRPISTSSQNPYAGGLAFDYYKYDGAAYTFFEGMRLNGSGILSVGTSSPYSGMSTKLYVGYPQDSTVNNADQFISVGAGGGSTNKAGINFLIYSAGYGGRIYTDDAVVRGLAFDVLQAGTFYNAMNITRTASPNVLINTTTDAGYRLDVNGTFRSQGTAYFGGNVNFSNQYRTYGLPYFEMGGGGITDEYLLLVPKYVSGTVDPYLLMGELQFQRGSTSTGNDNSVTTINIQTAYNQTNFYQFSINGATVWTSIDIISVSGVQWYALKARTSGGGPYLVNQFVGNLTDSGSQMLTRVRLSDAGVSLVTANVFLPSYTNYGNYIVRGTSFDSPYFALQGDQYTLVEMADRTSGATDVGFIGIYNENTKVIDIPGNSDKVYFNNGGNFLIGTTTDAGYKLDVNGTGRIQGNLYTTARQYVQVSGNTLVAYKIPYNGLSNVAGTTVSDSQASNGTAMVRYSTEGNNTFFYGPYTTLEPGNYVAKFRIKVASNASASYIGYIDVSGTNVNGQDISLRPNMFPTSGDYYYIDVPFTCNGSASNIEFRWIDWITGITDTYLDHVLVTSQAQANNVYVQDGGSYTIYEAQLPRLKIQNGSGNVGIGTTAPTTLLQVASSQTNSSIRTGGLEMQSYAVNNSWYAENVYFDGSSWRLRSNGYATQMYMQGGTIDFNRVATGAAGDAATLLTTIRLNNTGNVLIGTTADAGYKLRVNGTSYFDGLAHFGQTATSGSAFRWGSYGTAVSPDTMLCMNQLWNGSGWTILNANYGTTAINLGSAEASPTIRFETGGANTVATTKMIILNDGNVGIGTTAPYGRLELNGSGQSWTTAPAIRMWDSFNSKGWLVGNVNNITPGDFYIRTLPSVDGNPGTGQQEFTIKHATGNVGIGTTAPANKLEVDGGSSAVALRVSTTNTGVGVASLILSNSSKSAFNDGVKITHGAGYTNVTDLAGTSVMVWDMSNTRVGIGTTGPSYKLDVSGSARVNSTSNLAMFVKTNSAFGAAISYEDSTTGGNDVVSAGAIGGAFYIGTNFSEKMRVSSAGNVIIGSTTDAGYKLDVYGEILGRDDIRILNTYALILNGTDANWRIGRNTITDSGWLTGNTMQMVVFGSSSGQGFQVVNHNGTALFEIDGVAGASRFTNALGVGVNPSGTAGRIDASNDIVAYSTSDQRLKENITPIANAIDKVKALTGVEFDWKEETKDVHGYEGHDVGVIAQDVQAVLPEAVRTNDSGYLSVRYEKMIALLVEANKELASRVEELEKKLK